jgi:cytochrome c556
MLKLSLIPLTAALLMPTMANAYMTTEEAIKYRQSGYTFMSWNMARIRNSVENEFNRDDVVRSANAIAAIANSGMGSLFVPGSEAGSGWKATRVKPELFSDADGVAKVAIAFIKEANEMAKIAATASPAEVRAQFGKLGNSCKGCHDNYRGPNR